MVSPTSCRLDCPPMSTERRPRRTRAPCARTSALAPPFGCASRHRVQLLFPLRPSDFHVLHLRKLPQARPWMAVLSEYSKPSHGGRTNTRFVRPPCRRKAVLVTFAETKVTHSLASGMLSVRKR